MRHDERWTADKIAHLLRVITPLQYRRRSPLPAFLGRLFDESDPHPEGILTPEYDDRDWDVIAPGDYWGEWRHHFVLRGTFTIPEDWQAADNLALLLPIGETVEFSHPEALVYIDGMPISGTDRHHQEVRLPALVSDHQPHSLILDGWTGIGGPMMTTDKRRKLFMGDSTLAQIDPPTRELIAVTRVALETTRHLQERDPAKGRLLTALNTAFNTLDTSEPLGNSFYASVPEALARLREGVASAGHPLDVNITATGHAHIDLAWLWTTAQGRRKAARTFHTALHLMDQFPDYHFTQSQPQLYAWIEQDHPKLFEAIQRRVADGQWEPIGGMWVEADCNLTGAEALVRQFMLGTRYLSEKFPHDKISPVLWLPDVFGYAANLPQLMKQAGMEYFFTIKIGWNQYNRMPYDTFWWKGIDGTRILTHFSTTPEPGNIHNKGTYNANATPEAVLGSWLNVQEKDIQHDILMSYGWGDGGGGPTHEMIENIREMGNFPSLPKVQQGSVIDFFKQLEAHEQPAQPYPTWYGELYLEMHRGTYTTQARTKQANRYAERDLHNAEFLATMAWLLDKEYTYPHDTLREAWRVLCTNQFHDILPGSSIGEVYVEANERYAQVSKTAQAVSDSALEIVKNHFAGDLLIINPSGVGRNDLALAQFHFPEGKTLRRADGGWVMAQPVEDGLLIDAGQIRPYELVTLTIVDDDHRLPKSEATASMNGLENQFLRVELNDAGDISQIYDKHMHRDVLSPEALANQFQIFEDRPIRFDAWDIDSYYEDECWLAEPAESIRVVETGPLRATIEIKRRILHSTITQRISLESSSRLITFRTTVDWHENHMLLKVAFPVNILSPVATYGIQWGHVQRPTHRNTSWDWARFETCAHQWADLSEGGYGVGLVSDCKYGYDIHDNVMRLTLLRSPAEPDPQADQGEHTFTYGLVPHDMYDDSGSQDTIMSAHRLKQPLTTVQGNASQTPALSEKWHLLARTSENIIIETIKAAEDGSGIVIRLYDFLRWRRLVRLDFGLPVRAAWKSDILEKSRISLDVKGKHVHVDVAPFEIVTLIVEVERGVAFG
jgi:alpha-mannosidase